MSITGKHVMGLDRAYKAGLDSPKQFTEIRELAGIKNTDKDGEILVDTMGKVVSDRTLVANAFRAIKAKYGPQNPKSDKIVDKKGRKVAPVVWERISAYAAKLGIDIAETSDVDLDELLSAAE